jgi:hypothetical protein
MNGAAYASLAHWDLLRSLQMAAQKRSRPDGRRIAECTRIALEQGLDNGVNDPFGRWGTARALLITQPFPQRTTSTGLETSNPVMHRLPAHL